MEGFMTENVKNFIVFSHIQQLVQKLYNENQNDKNLVAYKALIDNANILSDDMTEFVTEFKRALNGKHRARYGDAHLNLPKFLSKNNNIQKDVDFIKLLYSNPEYCPEVQELIGYTEKIAPKLPTIDENDASQESIQNVLTSITPDVQETQKKFVSKELCLDRLIKMFLISIYDMLEVRAHELKPNDVVHIKNIIEIMTSTLRFNDESSSSPLAQLSSKKFEILSEFLQIEDKALITDVFDKLSSTGTTF